MAFSGLLSLLISTLIYSFAGTGVEYFNTFGGNPVSCAIALAVIDVIKKEKLQSFSKLIINILITVEHPNLFQHNMYCSKFV